MKFSDYTDYRIINYQSVLDEVNTVLQYYHNSICNGIIKVSTDDYMFFKICYANVMLNRETNNKKEIQLVRNASYWYLSDYQSVLSHEFIITVFDSWENIGKKYWNMSEYNQDWRYL